MKPQYSLYATHSQQNKIFFTKYYVKNIAFIKINIYNNRSPFQGIKILHKWIFSFIQVFSFLDVQFSSVAAFVI